MRKTYFIFTLILLIFSPSKAFAFWMWTPETNKWENPKYAVKNTPAEQLDYALSFYKSGQYPEALREFNKLLKHYPKAMEAPEAQFYIAVVHEEKGDLARAFKEYQVVIDKYPFSERSAGIVQKQYQIGERLLEGEGAKGKVIGAIIGSDYDVIEVFKTVIKNAPYGELAPPSQYKIGLYLLEKKMYQEARDEFEKVINDYPESEWVKAAQYQIAVTDFSRSAAAGYDQKVTQSAVREFEEFVNVYPDAELSKAAKSQIQELRDKEAENNFLVARFYEKQKNFKAARIYYQDIVDEYRKTAWAARAMKRLQELGKRE